MRECDIHRTRSIKTNSGVNQSRKPGRDICCDLRQHLQGVPRTCSFGFLHHIRASILLVSSLNAQVVFHMKCNQSNYRIMWMAVFAQFCFILFNM